MKQASLTIVSAVMCMATKVVAIQTVPSASTAVPFALMNTMLLPPRPTAGQIPEESEPFPKPIESGKPITVRGKKKSTVSPGIKRRPKGGVQKAVSTTSTVRWGSSFKTPQSVEVSLGAWGLPVEWYIPILVGSTKVDLLPDTGTSDAWIYSDLIPKSAQDRRYDFSRPVYPCAKKRNKPKGTFEVTYANSGKIKGVITKDTLQVGLLDVKNHIIGCASSDTSDRYESKPDGVLGLRITKNNNIKPKPKNGFTRIMDNIVNEGDLQDPVFTLYLFSDDEYVDLAKLEIGNCDCDDDKRKSARKSVTIQPPDSDHWSIRGVNGTYTHFDSGTEYFWLDHQFVEEYYKRIPNGFNIDTKVINSKQVKWYTVSCNARMPDITLPVTEKKTAIIPGSLLVGLPVDPLKPKGECYGTVQPRNGKTQVYGVRFFYSFTVCFNEDPRQTKRAPTINWCPKPELPAWDLGGKDTFGE